MSAVMKAESFIVEVEQEVLGTLLLGGDLRQVRSFLEPRHFVEQLHQLLYGYILQAFDRFSSTSPVIVLKMMPPEEARVLGAKLDKPIAAYLAALAANTVYGPARLGQSARKVVSQWARLAAAEEADRLHVALMDPGSDVTAVVTRSGQAFDDVLSYVRAGPRRKSRVSLADAAGNAIAASREAAQRGSGITGITWGLADVNRLTGGLQRRDLTLIAARPSMGKTTVGLSVSLAAAKAGIGAGFISLEMDADKLAARAVSDLAYDWAVKVPYADIIKGKSAELDALESATREIGKLPLIIEDQPGLSLSDIRVKIEAMMAAAEQAGKPLQMVVVDHLGLIKPSARYQGNRVQEVGELSAGLKALAREYGIALVALSQLNRALESRSDSQKRPQLSDLRDSGSLEQDADTIVLLYREAYYLEREKGGDADAQAERADKLIDKQNKLEFQIAKQRNGPIATVELFCDIACSAVRNGERP